MDLHRLRRSLRIEALEDRTLLTAAVALTTTNELIPFDTAAPDAAGAPLAITGLMAGEMVLGIDYRPLTGVLYAITNTDRMVTINTTTGAVTQVGMTFSTPLDGSKFGIDFNPSVDRLRVVSDSEQNLRLHPDTGAVAGVDIPLQFSHQDEYALTDPNVTAAAYINNYPGVNETLLFVIDSRYATLVLQAPPNNGTLNTVSPLGINTSDLVGFDISSQDGTDSAYALFSVGPGEVPQLYQLALYEYEAFFIGTLNTDRLILDMAVAIPTGSSPGAPGTPSDVIAALRLSEWEAVLPAQGSQAERMNTVLPVVFAQEAARTPAVADVAPSADRVMSSTLDGEDVLWNALTMTGF